jgi:ankyrin repeat protein
MRCARQGLADLAALLLAAGADVHARNRVGETAWAMAASTQQEDLDMLLQRAGAQVDPEMLAGCGLRLLHLGDALLAGDVEQVQGMLERGEVALDTALAPRGLTPLVVAVRRNDPAMVRMLLAAGAPVEPSRISGSAGEEGADAAHTLLEYAQDHDYEEIAEALRAASGGSS